MKMRIDRSIQTEITGNLGNNGLIFIEITNRASVIYLQNVTTFSMKIYQGKYLYCDFYSFYEQQTLYSPTCQTQRFSSHSMF